VLDATLLDELAWSVFWAELDNGHRFVAVARRCSAVRAGPAKVRVEFSPFDLSTGYVVESHGEAVRCNDEGT
jgi:hypothetical protein